MPEEKPQISLVIPLYNESESLSYLKERLDKLIIKSPLKIEVVLVDDGSIDDTSQKMKAMALANEKYQCVFLARNYGHQIALSAGLASAKCTEAAFIIDGDLQDPPELFLEMIKKWEKGKKVIIATRKEREDPLFRRIFTSVYYYLMSKYAIKNYPRGGFDFVLIDKQVAKELNRIREKNTNIMSLIFWFGYSPHYIHYKRVKSDKNLSRWTLSKRIKLFIDSFVAFSYAPIRFMSFVGLSTALLSFAYGIFVIISHFMGKISIQGYSTLIAVITFLLGLIMVMLGIIGEYLWRILDEARKRPPYIIDETYVDEK